MKREREDQEGVTDEMVKNTFSEAAKTGNIETLVSLMDDPRVNLDRALCIAARRGQVRVVRLLLADGRADPTAYRNSPLSNAARNGHVRVVRALMADSRVDPSVDDNYAMHWAAKENHIDVVRLLLQDPRVNALRALACATSPCAYMLAGHPRWGLRQYPDVYIKYRPGIVRLYRSVVVTRHVVMAWIGTRLPIWQDMVQLMANIWHADFLNETEGLLARY
jgi:hypothetical protein